MQLPKTAKKIKNSDDYIDIDGTIYYIEKRHNRKDIGTVKKKIQHNVQGYQYCGIHYYKKGNIQKRVHRLVAEAFIPNPNNYNVVGHRNNIKTDNRVENLYWTTTKENTQKAFDDGLIVNKKGFDDSQSIPVKQYETTTNRLLGEFGSMCEAEKLTGISKQIIRTQCKYKRPTHRDTYFRYFDDEDVCSNNNLIYCYDYNTDELVGVYFNTVDASKQTNIDVKYIQTCIYNNKKPKWTKQNKYFLRYKCESTIER